jgi:hypothetical protein
MNIERFIILVLLFIIGYLAYNKRPEYVHHQTDHVIERFKTITDTLKVEVIKYKQKAKIVRDTIEIIKIEVQEAKDNKDTLLIIKKQDTLINRLEVEVKYLYKSIYACDSALFIQNKTIELKDVVIGKQQKVIKKQKKRKKIGRFFAMVGTAILGTFIIIK